MVRTLKITNAILSLAVLFVLSGCVFGTTSVVDEDYTGGIAITAATLSISASSTILNSIDAGADYAFGTTTVGTSVEIAFLIKNTGMKKASELEVSNLVAPFSFSGGNYPGSTGNCGTELAGGASCTVIVTYTPTVVSQDEATFKLEYLNGKNKTVKQTVSKKLTGEGYSISPQITSLSPTRGSTLGGRTITITGSGFESGVTVTLGGNSCTSVTVVSASQLTCTIPTGVAGYVDLKVSKFGLSATYASSYQYMSPGVLDTSFNTTGVKYIKPVSSASQLLYSIAQQSDGKLVGVGNCYQTGSTTGFDLGIIRLKTDGTLDPDYNSVGYTCLNIGTGIDDGAFSVVIQPDGKILAAGYGKFGSYVRAVIVRYDSNGTLDTNFATSGIYTLDQAAGNDAFNSLLLDSSGNIYAAGYANDTTQSDFLLVKLDTNGALVTAFGTSGVKVLVPSSGNDTINEIKWGADGNLYAAGSIHNGADTDMALAAINPTTGALISTFGTSGIASTDFSSQNDGANGFVLQSDGKFILGGSASVTGVTNYAALRYSASGVLDTSFATSGKMTLQTTPMNTGGNSIALQSDGKFLMVSSEGNESASDHVVSVIRYNANGTPDATWGNNGRVTQQLKNNAGALSIRQRSKEVIIQSDGQIVITGYAHDGGSEQMVVSRYFP